MPDAAQDEVYKLQERAEGDLLAAFRALPDNYPRSGTMEKQFPTFCWRDPGGRFHIILVPRKGRASIVSFWADELMAMLKSPLFDMIPFLVDPLLTLEDVKSLTKKRLAPANWLPEVQSR